MRGRLEVLKLGIVGGLLVLLMIVTVGCDDAQPETTNQPTISSRGSTGDTVGKPPLPDLDKLVMSSDISIIGRVEVVSELQTVSRRDRPVDRVTYYEASVGVDRILFGQRRNRVDIQVSVRYLTDDDRHTPVQAPSLEVGETVLLFLTQDDSSFDLKGNNFVIAGGGEAWGKLFVRDGRVTTLDPAVESKLLDEVTEWIDAARFSLAKPGLLAGEMSGLDGGDRATIRLLYLGSGLREEEGVPVDEWTVGNGPWERRGLQLSEGTYHLVAEAEGYLPFYSAGGLMFQVPAEGMDWRERALGLAVFRPRDADDKPLSMGTGWRAERSVRGRILGIPDGVDARVGIQRLPPVPNEVYAIGPPLPKDTQLYFPPELTCLEEMEDLKPQETVAVVEVHNGRWGLSEHSLQGNRYLITIEAPGLRVEPAGYVAVVFESKTRHRVRGVDFYLGDSEGPSCNSGSGIVEPVVLETLRNIAQDPMARIAERVPGFGGAFRDSDQKVVYIYLQDASLKEEAERALEEEFGSDFLAGREVRVLEGDYSMDHLNAWYRTLSGTISQVPGIAYTDLDEGKNRIEIVMYPRRGGREKMEAAIATTDVPREAIIIEVGCEGIRQWPLDLGKPPEEAFPSAIEYSLEVESKAPSGEPVEMKLTLQNVSNEAVSFSLGGSPAYDFVVSTADGEYVWHSMCAKFALALLGSETLGPGEELEFVGEWEQVDNRGEPVPPGTYLVRAVLNLESPEKLVTEVQKVEVVQ